MKASWPKSETDLAKPVVAYLENLKWDVYQEVQMNWGGGIADIVATQGKIVWIIEVKKTLSLDLIAQAASWRYHAHFISVAIPVSMRRHGKGRRMAEKFLDWQGIGLIEVTAPYMPGSSYSQEATVTNSAYGQPQMGRLHRKAKAEKILKVLTPEHKTFAAAGNSAGKRWTPFQRTCSLVKKYVDENPGISMKKLVDSVDHHYASNAGARSSLARWIEADYIKGIEMRREGRLLQLYPVKEESNEPEASTGNSG
jgi:hypothetical protein